MKQNILGLLVCWLNPLPSPQMIIMKICCLLLGSTVHVSDRPMGFLLNIDFIFHVHVCEYGLHRNESLIFPVNRRA